MLSTNPPLRIAHRVLTIFVTAFAYASFEYCLSPVYLVSLVIWLIQSTTDQLLFLSLLGELLQWERPLVSHLFKAAAVQGGLFDAGSIIGLVVYWAFAENYNYRTINVLWNIIVWVAALAVLAGQAYGSTILWRKGKELEGVALPEGESLIHRHSSESAQSV